MKAIALPALSAADRERWTAALRLAVQEVFELMLATRIEMKAEMHPQELDVLAIVGLAGKLCGMVSLRCKSSSAARMASRMLGINGNEPGPDMWDAVGEICNMVAGNFKNKVAGLSDGCLLSVPTVITGPDYQVHYTMQETIETVFQFEGEPIVLLVEIQ